MILVQIKLPRTETYAWVGNSIFLETSHNGVNFLNGREISNEEKNRILDIHEQNGYKLVIHPDFIS